MSYYRASAAYLGPSTIIKPSGYYEGVDESGCPMRVGMSDEPEFLESDILETAASKYIGGAILGAYSMKSYSPAPKTIHIYKIDKKPDIDISHWDMDDFRYLEEVRYREPVQAKYIGSYSYSSEDKKKFDALYQLLSGKYEINKGKLLKQQVKDIEQYLKQKAPSPDRPLTVAEVRTTSISHILKKRTHAGIKGIV